MARKTLVFYTARARKDLKSLDGAISKKIVLYVEANTKKNPLKKAKVLKGAMEGLYRYRVNDYRVLFEIDEHGQVSILTILRIKHRKDVYKK